MAPMLFRRGSRATPTSPAPSEGPGHVYLDLHERVIHCLNDRARQLQHEGVPFSPGDLVRQPLHKLTGEPVTAEDMPLLMAWRAGHSREATFVLTKEGGAIQHISWSASPVKDPTGKVVGVLGSITCLAPEPDWQALAGLAHDLRTPLQSLKLLLAVLDHNPILDLGTREVLERVRSSSDRAMAIGLDLLEWCRAPVQRTRRRQPTWFPLDPFLRSLAAEHLVAAQHKSLVLTTNFDVVHGWEIHSEPVALGRLLSNLLVNAIRYTAAGRVEFTAAWHEPDDQGQRALNIGIVDSGVGISMEEQESIFQPYERGRAGKEDDSGPLSSGTGSGLGLSVVDRLSEELGLTLEVHSEHGRGSAFHVLISPAMLRPPA